MAQESPNAEQIEYWDQVTGPKWAELSDDIDALIAPFGDRALEAAAAAPGERVLDVGCGCGPTTAALAESVGGSGGVLGIDVSGPMLGVARARGAGLPQLDFLQADAQVHDFSGSPFDLVFSRFGVMFFADPAAAFGNLRGALQPSGRLVFVCWQAPELNPWMIGPAAAAAKHVPAPEPPPPGAPGPFSLSDADHLSGLLEAAGYSGVELDAVALEVDVIGGRSWEQALDFMLQMGPTLRMLAEADDSTRARVRESVRELLESRRRGEGSYFDAAAWIVRARP